MDTFVLRRRRRPRSVGRHVHPVPARIRRPVARVRDQTRLRRSVSHPRRRLRDRGRFPDAPRPRCCVSTVSSRKGARGGGDGDGGACARRASRGRSRDDGGGGSHPRVGVSRLRRVVTGMARVEDRSDAKRRGYGPHARTRVRARPSAPGREGRRGSRRRVVATSSRGFGKRRRRLFPGRRRPSANRRPGPRSGRRRGWVSNR